MTFRPVCQVESLTRTTVEITADSLLKLSAQRALLTNVTLPLRSVSVELDEPRKVVRVRFIFERQPSPSEWGAASSAAGEIIADYPAPWIIDEEYIVTPASEPMSHLKLLVFHRCEDEWVTPEH